MHWRNAYNCTLLTAKRLISEALGWENLSDDWRVNPNLPVPPEPDPGETANDHDAPCTLQVVRRAA